MATAGLRPPTAFELFLQRRQQDLGAASLKPQHAQPTLGLEPSPTRLPRGDQHASKAASPPQPVPPAPHRRSSQHPTGRERGVPDLQPQLIASIPSPRFAAHDAPGGGGRGGGAMKPATPASSAVYGELASAAASLASAAQKLASRSSADAAVASSYETLAQAASDLAASACMIRPLALPGPSGRRRASTSGGAGGAGGRTGHALASSPRAQRQPSRSLDDSRGGFLPRAVDPVAASAGVGGPHTLTLGGSDGGGFAGGGGGGGGGREPGAGASPGRPGTSASHGRARVAVPRFPGYNPLIHVLESDLPMPGMSGVPRPPSSSPITHRLEDSRLLRSSAGRSSIAGSRQLRGSRSMLPRTADARRPGSTLFPPDAMPPPSYLHHTQQQQQQVHSLRPEDVSRLPVLSLSADGAAQAFSAGAAGEPVWGSQRMRVETDGGGSGGGGGGGGAGGGDANARAGGWQEVPVTTYDMEQDELDTRYNKVLAALRDRLSARGPGRLAAAFRACDREGSGLLSMRDFVAVLRGLNLGGPELLDERVVDLMLAGVRDSSRAAVAVPPAAAAAAATADAGPSPALPAVPAAAVARHHYSWSSQQHPSLHNPQHQQDPGHQQVPVVAYGDFLNALRFGSLPWRGYDRRLRHRVGADPDQPIGPPALSGAPPYGTAYGEASVAGAAAAGAGPRDPAPWGELHRPKTTQSEAYLGPPVDRPRPGRAQLSGYRLGAGQDTAAGWPGPDLHAGAAAVLKWLSDQE